MIVIADRQTLIATYRVAITVKNMRSKNIKINRWFVPSVM